MLQFGREFNNIDVPYPNLGSAHIPHLNLFTAIPLINHNSQVTYQRFSDRLINKLLNSLKRKGIKQRQLGPNQRVQTLSVF